MYEGQELAVTQQQSEIQKRREESYDMQAYRKMPFFTALWATLGLSILAGFVIDGGSILASMKESWFIVIPFVTGVYVSSYALGGVMARKRIRENFFISLVMSFLVSEGVLFIGSVLAAIGAFIGGETDISGMLGAPFIMVMFGSMFCLPLALGMGTHIRAWSAFAQKREQNKLLKEELQKNASNPPNQGLLAQSHVR